LGLKAWPELYGLVETDARLRAGRVAPTLAPEELSYMLPERLEELQAGLDASPYHGLTFVCPMTPNPSAHGARSQTFDRYAHWLTQELLPRVRQELPLAKSFGIAGCSMGGPAALESFLRYPNVFSSVGMVQGAFGEFRAPDYATRLKAIFDRHGPTAIQLLTSTRDPYEAGNRALSDELAKLGIRAQLDVPRGPHNQPFLRQIGTLLMLRFHDAALAG
jgi:pimeloyl-ACP methyl ester carboxylesterase